MRNSLTYLIGIISLVVVLGVSHVTMAYVSWSPTITPSYATSIVSNLQASYTWGTSSPIGPTSSNPLYVYIPGNVYLGWYANGYYYTAVNFTVTLYNSGPTSGSATVYVSCPSPLGSTSASVTVGATSSASVTLTLTANINGPVTQPGQFLQCSIYTSLTTNNVTAVSVQLPVEITNYGIDLYSGTYHPAFSEQFYAPYFTFSGSTYEPSLSIVPFAGLTMGSTLFLVQTGTSASDTSTFSLPTPSSAGQSYSLEFIIASLPYQASTGSGNTYYSIVPIIYAFYNYLFTIGTSMFINQNSGATMTTIYASPNGITIIPMGATYAVYTNSTRWFTYTVQVLPHDGLWQMHTGIAFPATPGKNNEFYALVFMRNSTMYGSHLPVPVLFMFNVVNPGYKMNTTLFTQVNGTSSNPLPSGLGLSAVFNIHGNYTIANITMSTPIINLTSSLLLVGAYGYAPGNWSFSNEYVLPAPGGLAFYRMWGTYAYSSTEDVLILWGITSYSIASSAYVGQFSVTRLNGYSFPNYFITPVFNLTVTSSGSAPTWTLGISLQDLVILMGKNHGVVIVMPYDYGSYISTPSISSNHLEEPISAYGFRQYVSTHMLQYFINATDNKFYLLAYPWGSINATVINIYPNGTYVTVGYKLVPVLNSGRSINETVASYFVLNTGTFVNDLILTLDQTPQVAALYNAQFAPGVQVYATGYTNMSRAPKVTTSSSGYVYMGYAIPQDVAYSFGSTNEVYTTIYVTKYLIGTLYAQYQSVAGPEQYSYTLPVSDDPVVGLELLEQPQNVISVSSVSVSPTNVTASPGETVNITVTVTLSQAPQVTQSYQGTVTLNGTTVASFTISVPAGSTSASTTVTFNAPSTAGKYNGVVSVDGKSALFTLTVTTPPTMLPTAGLAIFIIIIIIAVIAYLIHRKRRGEVVVRL